MSEYSKRMNRNKKFEFTFEPKSLWYYEKNKVLEDICDTGYGKEIAEDRIHAGRQTFMSGWNKEFQKRLIEFYTAEGDTILDPFAGHSSSFMPYLMKRKFIGFEITKERYDIQIEHLTKLREKYKIDNEIRLINDSSEYMYMYDIDKVDCIITDPPFWVAEKYEDPVGCGTQLSHIKDYNEFLESLNDILTKSIGHLRNNGFLIIKVADVRKDRRFYDLTTDVINMLKNKITLVDKIVLELNPSKRHPLYIQAITNKNMLKVQEYCLVFRKEWLEDIEKDNDRINHNRIKVKDVYDNESELFWSSKRGKVDYITNSLKED